MILRVLFATALTLGFAGPPLSAQIIKPLEAYEGLQRIATDKLPAAVEKVDCAPLDLSEYNVLRPGEDLELTVRPDTSELGSMITYTCTGCSTAEGGVAFLRRDTLLYTATAGIQEALDTLTIQACTNDGATCGDPLQVLVLVQREGVVRMQPAQTVAPGGEINLPIPMDAFALKATCRSIESCAPNYPGRERRFYFITNQATSNDFAYFSARYGGTDAVCVTLCTDLGLCDTYRTEITVNRPSIGLPFFDDFSADDFRTDKQLWQDEDVLVNRNFAQDPPSVGVATFDAIDSDGSPYPATGGGRNTVIRDFLTSSPLEMAGRNGAALSFYLQPRGFGNRPETQDSFLVQFLHPDGVWRTVLKVEGLTGTFPSSRAAPFIPYLIPLSSEYLYNGFTFRFANKNNEVGAVDMWHLDYVKLDVTSNTIATDDLALTQEPGPILGPYTSLPLRHFQASGEELVEPALRLGLYNLGAVARDPIFSTDKSSEIIVRNEAREFITNDTLNTVFGLGGSIGAQAYEINTVRPGWDGFALVRNYLNGLDDDGEPVRLSTEYSILPSMETAALGPGVDRNNRISTTTVLDEYMSYDDGSAEAIVEITEQSLMVQRYTAFIEDELKGIQIRIPRGLGGLGDQPLRLVVYAGDSLPTDQLYSEDFDVIIPEDIIQDSLEGFTTYLFDEPLPLPVGTFFVGWQQQRAPRRINVGFDRNTDASGQQFLDFGNGWQVFSGGATGALMLRPLLGGFSGFQTSTDDVEIVPALVDVFPNPTSGTLHLRPRQLSDVYKLELRLFSLAGALLQTQSGTDRLDLSGLPAGAYFLEVSNGSRWSHHKVIRN